MQKRAWDQEPEQMKSLFTARGTATHQPLNPECGPILRTQDPTTLAPRRSLEQLLQNLQACPYAGPPTGPRARAHALDHIQGPPVCDASGPSLAVRPCSGGVDPKGEALHQGLGLA